MIKNNDALSLVYNYILHYIRKMSLARSCYAQKDQHLRLDYLRLLGRPRLCQLIFTQLTDQRSHVHVLLKHFNLYT